jgi:hypothetical protein
MKKFLFVYLFLIIIFPGCSQRLINWGKKRLNQGCKIENYECLAYQYIRTTKVYDQFRTMGIFNAMWLSDIVRKAYVNVHCQKFVLSEDVYRNLIELEESKNKKTIAFYILVWYPRWCGAEFDKPNSRWLVFLKVGDKAYTPRIIKRIELPCEYVIFFNKLYNNFKRSYYVEFDALDDHGDKILNYKEDMVLCLRSYDRITYMRWEFGEDGCLLARHYDESATCQSYDACGDCKCLNVVK